MTRFTGLNRDWASIARRDGYADGKAGRQGRDANQFYQRGWREGNKAREKALARKGHQSCATHPCGPKCPHIRLFHRSGNVMAPTDDTRVGGLPPGEPFSHRLARLRKIVEAVPYNFNAEHAHQWAGLRNVDDLLDAIPPTVMLELISAAEANQLPQEVATLALTEAEQIRERVADWLPREDHGADRPACDPERSAVVFREKAERLLSEIQ